MAIATLDTDIALAASFAVPEVLEDRTICTSMAEVGQALPRIPWSNHYRQAHWSKP